MTYQRAEERRAVVEWLRVPGAEWPRETAHAKLLADAIERGDHITGKE